MERKYETAFSLKKRLEKRYAAVTLGTVKGFAEMLAFIAEQDGMPKLPFIRK